MVVRVGAKITIATAALVTATMGVYAFLDLRAEARERSSTVEREAKYIALSMRASIENASNSPGRPSWMTDGGVASALEKTLNHTVAPWEIAIIPARDPAVLSANAVAALPPGDPAASNTATNGTTADITAAITATTTVRQRERLRTLRDVPGMHLMTEEQDRLIYVLPLRVSAPLSPTGYKVVGSLEVSRSIEFLDSQLRADIQRTLPVLAVIAALSTLAIAWLTSTLMIQPIRKLLAGIDDVAQGDLSRVLLSERDDEIGTLATRFNEMTFYLRESQAETKRQNDARLGLEERLRTTEKMATIGLFAAEIAHELGTPLNVISARARSISKKAQNPETVVKHAGIITEQADRIARIIQQTLDHARHQGGNMEFTAVDIESLTGATLELYQAKCEAAGITINRRLRTALPSITGDADRLQQVLINLFNNALQAMPQGGQLNVNSHLETRRRPGLSHAPEQQYLVIEVSDSGDGIPEEQRDKIFEPFHTSKREQGGTGLGLAVCFSIVKDHDGWISIEDAPTGGAVFAVYLPTSD